MLCGATPDSPGQCIDRQRIAAQRSARHSRATRQAFFEGLPRGSTSHRKARQCIARHGSAEHRTAKQSNAASILETGCWSRGFPLTAKHRIARQCNAAQCTAQKSNAACYLATGGSPRGFPLTAKQRNAEHGTATQSTEKQRGQPFTEGCPSRFDSSQRIERHCIEPQCKASKSNAACYLAAGGRPRGFPLIAAQSRAVNCKALKSSAKQRG